MQIHIPTPLRPYAGKQPVVDVSAKTVAEALKALDLAVSRAAQASLYG